MQRGRRKGEWQQQKRRMVEIATEETRQRCRTISMAEAEMWDGVDGVR